MQPVRAFVGHSFTAEDGQVVRAFTDYLDHLARLLTDFSWEHATLPEPALVDEKVLALFADKNVFVGICTRKEFVVRPSALRPALLPRRHLRGATAEFQWKTSDWIIQEIGVAIGRGIRIILLIEDGVRMPGALQGNLEYIPFNRSAPDVAFSRLGDMLAAVAGRPSAGHAEGGTQRIQPARPQEPAVTDAESGASEEFRDPQPDWDLRTYELAWLVRRDGGAVAEIETAFLMSSLAAEPANRRHFDAWKDYVRIVGHNGGDLNRLRELARNAHGTDAHEIWNFYGKALEALGEFGDAAAAFERSADLAEDARARAKGLADEAKVHSKAGLPARAETVQERLRELAGKDESILEIALRSEAHLALAAGDDPTYFGALEAAIQLVPEDLPLRFDLAYRYSQCGHEELSLYHYARIPIGARDGTHWNNLGVQLQTLGMPAISIDAFRRAAELGITRATANVADRFIDAGFIQEATDLLNGASRSPDHDENVDKQLARAKGIFEEEDTLLKKLLSGARPQSDFFRAFGRALAATTVELSGRWQGPRCALEVTIGGRDFQAVGTFERSLGLIANAILYPFGQAPPQRVPVTVKYVGKVKGGTVHGEVSKEESGSKELSTLLSSHPVTTFMAWIGASEGILHVVEFRDGKQAGAAYELRRLI